MKCMSKTSRNVICSESKGQHQTTRGDWGKRGIYWRPSLIALLLTNNLNYSYPLLMAVTSSYVSHASMYKGCELERRLFFLIASKNIIFPAKHLNSLHVNWKLQTQRQATSPHLLLNLFLHQPKCLRTSTQNSNQTEANPKLIESWGWASWLTQHDRKPRVCRVLLCSLSSSGDSKRHEASANQIESRAWAIWLAFGSKRVKRVSSRMQWLRWLTRTWLTHPTCEKYQRLNENRK